MWAYLAVFFSSLAVDLVPVVAPPAWTVMVFMVVKFDLNPWLVLLFGVPGSTLGRFLFSLYVPRFTDRLIRRHKKEELQFLGKKLNRNLWRSWLFVFVYSVTPLSTTALFMAAAMAKVKPLHTVPPFFCGKFLSDAVIVLSARYATETVRNLRQGAVSWPGIVIVAVGLALTAAFLFIDWRALLQRKQFRFNFNIWK